MDQGRTVRTGTLQATFLRCQVESKEDDGTVLEEKCVAFPIIEGCNDGVFSQGVLVRTANRSLVQLHNVDLSADEVSFDGQEGLGLWIYRLEDGGRWVCVVESVLPWQVPVDDSCGWGRRWTVLIRVGA